MSRTQLECCIDQSKSTFRLDFDGLNISGTFRYIKEPLDDTDVIILTVDASSSELGFDADAIKDVFKKSSGCKNELRVVFSEGKRSSVTK